MSTVLIGGLLFRNDCITSILRGSIRKQLFCRRYVHAKMMLNTNEAYIMYDQGSSTFKMSFRYINEELNLDKQVNLCRKTNETVGHFLGRLNISLLKVVNEKMRRLRKSNPPLEEHIDDNSMEQSRFRILQNNSVMRENLPCTSFLEDSGEYKLVIFGMEYMFRKNVPMVIEMKLPESIHMGCPTYPSKFLSMYTDRSKSTFYWYKAPMFSNGNSVWTLIGKGYLYIPDESDIGCQLKVVCQPRNETQNGLVTETESHNVVIQGPETFPFETRHESVQGSLSGKSFRIMSYNVLADTYADTTYSKEVLFPYCEPHALRIDYRKQLIIKELLGFKPDIMCLQEVDSSVYKNDLIVVLPLFKYDGIYNTKKELNEGLAIFFDTTRFDKIGSDHSIISQNTTSDIFFPVWSKIKNEKVRERFLNRSTVIQVLILRSKENPLEILVIGNTHLYFHPNASHIRLLQAFYAIQYVHNLAAVTQRQNPFCNVSVILSGDFNSTPEWGIYKLMTEQYVPEDSADWSTNPEEIVSDVSLEHSVTLASACGTPEYTNYTPTFKGCLDYIFYQTEFLEVQKVFPMPNNNEVQLHKGLPSVIFPSDHISLCAELRWR